MSEPTPTSTAKGRRALASWLQQPSKRFTYESEAMLKVSFGDMADLAELARTLEEIRAEAEDDLRVAQKAFAKRLSDGVPFPNESTSTPSWRNSVSR